MSTSKESGYMSPLSGNWPLMKMAVKTMNPGQSYEENLTYLALSRTKWRTEIMFRHMKLLMLLLW